jgi:hypothetical protein
MIKIIEKFTCFNYPVTRLCIYTSWMLELNVLQAVYTKI